MANDELCTVANKIPSINSEIFPPIDDAICILPNPNTDNTGALPPNTSPNFILQVNDKQSPSTVKIHPTVQDDVIDTSHIEGLLLTFLCKIGWTANALTLLSPLQITNLRTITSIPVRKID